MIYGYARVSTKGQAKDGNSLEAQEKALRDAGAMEIYTDAFTGTKTHRPELDKLLSVMVAGDTMVTTKLDRIARSVSQDSDLIQSLYLIKVFMNIDWTVSAAFMVRLADLGYRKAKAMYIIAPNGLRFDVSTIRRYL